MKTNLFKNISKFEIAETYANMLFDDFCKHLDVIGGIEHIDIEERVYRFLKSKSKKLNDIEITKVYKTNINHEIYGNFEFDFAGQADYSYIDVTINKDEIEVYLPHTKEPMKNGGSLTSFTSLATLNFQREHKINTKCRFPIMDVYIKACFNSETEADFSKEFSKLLIEDYFHSTAECCVNLAILNTNVAFFLSGLIDTAINNNHKEVENYMLGKTRTDYTEISSADEILIKYKKGVWLHSDAAIEIEDSFEFIAKFSGFFFKFKVYDLDQAERKNVKLYNPYSNRNRQLEIHAIEKSELNELSIADEEGYATDEHFELFKMILYKNSSALIEPTPENLENVYNTVVLRRTVENIFLVDYIAEKEGITKNDVLDYIQNNLQQGEL